MNESMSLLLELSNMIAIKSDEWIFLITDSVILGISIIRISIWLRFISVFTNSINSLELVGVSFSLKLFVIISSCVNSFFSEKK